MSIYRCFNVLKLSNRFAEQRGTCAPRDADTNGIANVVVALVEHHHFVLGRTAAQLFVRTFAEILHQHIESVTHIEGVALG